MTFLGDYQQPLLQISCVLFKMSSENLKIEKSVKETVQNTPL